MCYKEPVIRGVMRGNYIFRCGEWLEEIREISVLLSEPKMGRETIGKRKKRRGSGSHYCEADAEDTDVIHSKVKSEDDHILMDFL